MADTNRKEVDNLLEMYAEYKAVSQREAAVSLELAKLKLHGSPPRELIDKHTDLKNKLIIISDNMTFASPTIWMMYKYEAYKNEAQPILTMQDFRIHCSKPGYICTKRFNFVNEQLRQQGLLEMSDFNEYPDELLLPNLFKSAEIASLESNSDFQNLWAKYEYYKLNNLVAKWENY